MRRALLGNWSERRIYIDVSAKPKLSSWVECLRFTLAYVAPSGNIIFTSTSLTTAPGMTVWMGKPTIYKPVLASYPAESARGESHPKVNE